MADKTIFVPLGSNYCADLEHLAKTCIISKLLCGNEKIIHSLKTNLDGIKYTPLQFTCNSHLREFQLTF